MDAYTNRDCGREGGVERPALQGKWLLLRPAV